MQVRIAVAHLLGAILVRHPVGDGSGTAGRLDPVLLHHQAGGSGLVGVATISGRGHSLHVVCETAFASGCRANWAGTGKEKIFGAGEGQIVGAGEREGEGKMVGAGEEEIGGAHRNWWSQQQQLAGSNRYYNTSVVGWIK